MFTAAVSVILASPLISPADPITYSFSGTASGNIDGAPFSNTRFTILFNTDTQTVNGLTPYGFYTIEDDLSSTIELAGIGSGTFIENKRVFLSTTSSVLGLGRGVIGPGAGDLLNITNPSFATYDLKTTLDPLFVGAPLNLQFTDQTTTMGSVTITSANSIVFAANVIPEPASAIMLLMGGPIIAGYRSIRKRYGI